MTGSGDEDSNGGIKISRVLSKQLKKPRAPNGVWVAQRDTLTLCGPSRTKPLSPYERTCLQEFILSHEQVRPHRNDMDEMDLDAEADSYDVPTHCRVFRSVIYNTAN